MDSRDKNQTQQSRGARTQKNVAARTTPSVAITAGDSLEYRVMRLFAYSGYFVRRGVEIYTEQYLNRATDLDVFAMKFTPTFARQIHIAECKSGSSRALDRIFWLSGVRHYAKADRATLVRDSTKWDIKDFARKNGVEILDHAALARQEENLGLDTSYWPGVLEREFIAKNANDWTALARKDDETALLIAFVSGESEYARIVPSIRYLIFNMRRFVKFAAERPKQTLWPLLLVECLSQLCVFLLALAAVGVTLTEADVRGLVHKQLKYGTLDPRILERMMRLAKRVAEEALHEAGVSPKRIEPEYFDYPEPSLVDEVMALHNSVAKAPLYSVDLPQLSDYIFGETYLRNRTALPWLKTTFSSADIDGKVRVLAAVCDQLIALGALPEAFRAILAGLRRNEHGEWGVQTLQEGSVEKRDNAKVATEAESKDATSAVTEPRPQTLFESGKS